MADDPTLTVEPTDKDQAPKKIKTVTVKTPLGERLANIRAKADEQIAVMQQMNASVAHAPTAAVGSVATVVVGLVTELEAAYAKLGEPLDQEIEVDDDGK